jgi:hypothetical protein
MGSVFQTIRNQQKKHSKVKNNVEQKTIFIGFFLQPMRVNKGTIVTDIDLSRDYFINVLNPYNENGLFFHTVNKKYLAIY